MAVHPGTQRILAVSCLKKPRGNDVVDDVLTHALPKHKNMNGVIIDRVCSFLPRAKSQAKFRQTNHWSVDFFHAHGHNASCPCNLHHIPRLARCFKGISTSAAEQVFAWFRNYARVLNETTAMRHSFKVLYFCKLQNTAMQKDGSFLLVRVSPQGREALCLLLLPPGKCSRSHLESRHGCTVHYKLPSAWGARCKTNLSSGFLAIS